MKWLAQFKLLFERLCPVIYAVIALAMWVRLEGKFPESDSLISATLSVAGVFVGFLATAKAILISMNSPIIAEIKESGYINDLVSYIGQAIWFNLSFCVVNVAGYFDLYKLEFYGYFWIFFAMASLISFIRVTDIMLKIFKYN